MSTALHLVAGATPDEPTRRYDVEMISDFLRHLAFELKALHFDLASGGRAHPEIDETLCTYVMQSGAEQLVPAPRFDRALSPDEQRRFDRWLRGWLECNIARLDGLVDGILGDALRCVSMAAAGTELPIVQPVSADAIMAALPE
jgi:hypothetical protein